MAGEPLFFDLMAGAMAFRSDGWRARPENLPRAPPEVE